MTSEPEDLLTHAHRKSPALCGGDCRANDRDGECWTSLRIGMRRAFGLSRSRGKPGAFLSPDAPEKERRGGRKIKLDIFFTHDHPNT